MSISARSIVLAFLATVAVFVAADARGQVYWSYSSGDWSNPSYWSGSQVPTSGDTAYIQNGGTTAITSPGKTCGVLYLGGGAGSGTVLISAGSLATISDENIGYAGNGSFTQSGGTNTAGNVYLGLNLGSSGAYSLGGSGLLSVGDEYIGFDGTGSFTQTGGTHSVAQDLILGYSDGSGAYNLGGRALLSVRDEYIGYRATGTFTQMGGTNSVYSYLYLGNNAGSTGTYNLSGGGLLSSEFEEIGNAGSGSFTQTGGTNSMSYVLYLGNNAGGSGTYALSGSGLVSAGYEYIGVSGNGSFNQSGGTNAVSGGSYNNGALYLGFVPGSSGKYNLSGSGLLTAPTEYIGFGGASGSFTQSGGTNSVSSVLVLGQSASSAGTYSLNGGLLSLASLAQGDGSATFDFSGGTFQAASTFSTGVPIVLCTAGSNGVFDTNGNVLTLAGVLSGPGGLQKTGSGTLTLSASNRYTGRTLVSAGTLLLTNIAAVSGSTFDTSGHGLLSFGTLASATFGGLQGSGSLALNNSSEVAVALSVGGNNDSTSFSGGLSGSNSGGSLIKVGTGTLVLSGTNTYLGGTTVNRGSLVVTNNEALADGSNLYVGNAGLLELLPEAVVPSPVVSTNAVGSGSSATAVSPVPEPGTLALLVAGAALMAMYRKRR